MGKGETRSHEQTAGQHPARPGICLPAFLAICALMVFARQAEAFSLLSIRDFSQSAGLSYAFTHSSAQGTASNTEHEFTEDYGVNFSYSLLSPLLLKGTSFLDLEWDQLSSDSGSGTRSNSDFRLRYNINGLLLSGKPYPVSFSATSTRETVSQSFAPSYVNTTDTLMARLAVTNAFVPSSIAVTRLTQETSGFNRNFKQTANTLSLAVNPNLGKAGSLSLVSTWSDAESTSLDTNLTTDNSTVSAHAGYNIGWKSDRGLTRTFSLMDTYQETAGTMPLTTQNLNGNLLWQLGKALDATLLYLRGYTRATSFSNENQAGGLSLNHRLFDSVSTGINLTASEDRFNGGTNRLYRGGVSLRYHKLLPESSSLSIGYSFNQGISEQTGDVSVVGVVNEQHPIPTVIPRRIALAFPTFDPASIQVVGAQTLLPYPTSAFTIIPEGIELTSFIAGDTAVLISYSYRRDPNVTTSTVSHGISSSLSLHQDKYRLYADASLSDQHLVKGEATSLTLTNTRHYDAGATARLSRHTLNAEIGYDKSYAQDLYYLTTSWSYAAPFAGGDLSVTSNDRYTWQSLSQMSGREGFWINSFNAQSEYLRALGFLVGRFRADYANVMVQGKGTSHTAVLGVNIEGKYGKLFLLLTSTAAWTFTDNGDSSSQGVGISVRRVF